MPATLQWQGKTYAVVEVVKRWRCDTGWWDSRLWREYVKLIVAPNVLLIVYRDLVTESWWLQRLYD